MAEHVKPPRTRRVRRAEETRQRILDAATRLFAEVGFAGTTIEAIAEASDVAVETVYSRFRNKATLLEAILGPAISGSDDGRTLFDRPEFAAIRACREQRAQLRLMAQFSRGVLERTDRIHRILHMAAVVDTHAAALEQSDRERRHRSQRAYIDLLLSNGGLRAGLTPQRAADTYAALANPASYEFFVGQLKWTPLQFEEWLCESLTLLLLP